MYIETKKVFGTVHIRKGYKSRIWEEYCVASFLPRKITWPSSNLREAFYEYMPHSE